MERRTFLKGVLTGVTGAGMIVTATPREIEAFASPLGSSVILGQPTTLPTGTGEFLYNAHGNIVAVIREVMVRREPFAYDSFTGGHYVVPGFLEWDLRAQGIGHIDWSKEKGLQLLGVDRL